MFDRPATIVKGKEKTVRENQISPLNFWWLDTRSMVVAAAVVLAHYRFPAHTGYKVESMNRNECIITLRELCFISNSGVGRYVRAANFYDLCDSPTC